MAESLPSSISAFSHRRRRSESIASFTYHPDEDDEALRSVDGRSDFGDLYTDEAADDDDDELSFLPGDEDARSYYSTRRRSSTISRHSVHTRLLRLDSTQSAKTGRLPPRVSQKTYLANEDLTVVVAGFKTRRSGHIIYVLLCVLTLGLGYLLLRWLPRWYIALVGQPCPLESCGWVVVEVCRLS
jgi:cation-transporting ATPase 13A3/4/5